MSDITFEPIPVDEQELAKQKEFEEYLESLRNGICVGLGIPENVVVHSKMELDVRHDLAIEKIMEKSKD